MSSQRLVWERVDAEIARNPFCIGTQPLDYLLRVAEQIGLNRTTFPLELFQRELLAGAFMRSIAKVLARQKLEFHVYGSGWDEVEELGKRRRGVISNDIDLDRALGSTSMLIDVWPGASAHPARRAGRPVLRPWGRDLAGVVRELKRASLATPILGDAPVVDLERVLKTL
jgi:hypothetical protein